MNNDVWLPLSPFTWNRAGGGVGREEGNRLGQWGAWEEAFFRLQSLIQDQIQNQSKNLTYPVRWGSDFPLLPDSWAFSRQAPLVPYVSGRSPPSPQSKGWTVTPTSLTSLTLILAFNFWPPEAQVCLQGAGNFQWVESPSHLPTPFQHLSPKPRSFTGSPPCGRDVMSKRHKGRCCCSGRTADGPRIFQNQNRPGLDCFSANIVPCWV